MKDEPTAFEIEDIAFVCHEANRAYCFTLGDKSQKTWAEAPEWQCESVRNGVRFHVANPDADASASHESWLEEKRENGWVYGEVKDEVKKTHPCFVPFEGLPIEQQRKDHLFRAIVHAMLVGR